MKPMRSTKHAHHWMLLMVVGALGVVAQAQSIPAQPRWAVSSDGLTVVDRETWLTWARCAAGQAPPACTGRAKTYTHEQALAYATSQTGWRLPNVNELSSLVDHSVVLGMGAATIDATAFPNTSASWFWSAWSVEGHPAYAWSVNFERGYIDYNFRHYANLVRLVR